jgi:hypothetical protein
VLKRDQKKEEKQEISIEELVDTERAALGSNLTKVTLDTFTAWKQKKLREKKEALAVEAAKKKKSVMEGKLSKVRLRASSLLLLLFRFLDLILLLARFTHLDRSPVATCSRTTPRWPSKMTMRLPTHPPTRCARRRR